MSMPTRFPTLSMLILCFAGLWLIPAAATAGQAARLQIDENDDVQMLPFAAEILWQQELPERQGSLFHPIHVIAPVGPNDRPGLLFSAFNFLPTSGDPSMLKVSRWPGMTIFDENPVRLMLSDAAVLPTPDTAPATMVGTGVRNDSGFFFVYQPEREHYREHFVIAGTDRTGDGRWAGTLIITTLVDLDGDGFDEVLIFVSASRDGLPRDLLCVNPVTGAVSWRLSVASLVRTPGQFFVRAEEPRLIFVTSCPAQGFRDSLFMDGYSYFVAITSNGQVATRKMVARYSEPAELVYDNQTDRILLYHSFAPTEDTLVADTAAKIPQLSIITPDGRVITNTRLTDEINPMWLFDYVPGGGRELYTLSPDGTIRMYDTALQWLAESQHSTLGAYMGQLISLPEHRSTFLMRDERGHTILFTPSFEKLAVLPDMTYCEIIDQQPGADSLVLASTIPPGGIALVRIRPRSVAEFVAILFQRYRMYILAILCSLLVGLVTVNFYRVRTRQNLDVISAQKLEIERTHEELKAAQQKIIEAEKYRQAQDIAGGFAHEIRNALLPAQLAHQKLRRQQPEQTETIARADHAIRRALDLTEAISRYTRLESTEHAESVELATVLRVVLQDVAGRLEDDGISTTIIDTPSLRVHADPEHVRLLFSNLLTNAIDALAGQPVREITVTVDRKDTEAVVTVSDTGRGIDPAILPRMFHPFVSGKPRDGHGLGLSLVSRIVALYGGSVWATPRAAGGAEIGFSLPLENHA